MNDLSTILILGAIAALAAVILGPVLLVRSLFHRGRGKRPLI
jgi:hypothetical protein